MEEIHYTNPNYSVRNQRRSLPQHDFIQRMRLSKVRCVGDSHPEFLHACVVQRLLPENLFEEKSLTSVTVRMQSMWS